MGSQAAGLGLLLAMMEPPPGMEAEFNAWYDTEHLPQRAAIDGFLTARRFICIQGWPRYLALYDLVQRDVLEGPGYRAIARGRHTPWTGRVIARVLGHYRAEADQIVPGAACLGEAGACARLLALRFSAVSAGMQSALVEATAAFTATNPGLAQARLFAAPQAHGTDCLVLAEWSPTTLPAPGLGAFAAAARHLDLCNTYVPYFTQ